jgi:hypothetical protein
MMIVFTLCAFLKYWAYLYKEAEAVKIKDGAHRVINKASAIVRNLQHSSDQPVMLMIEGP